MEGGMMLRRGLTQRLVMAFVIQEMECLRRADPIHVGDTLREEPGLLPLIISS